MSETVLILGAAGRLGQCLVRAFAEARWSVMAQARKPLAASIEALPNVQSVRCDALDVQALTGAAQGAQVVINALNPVYTEWDRLALPLSDAALAVAVRLEALLMLPGNVYNFGHDMPETLGPDTPEQANTPKARIRIEMEGRMAARCAHGLNSVVIRAGDFFGGAGPGSWFDLALASRVAKGRFVYPGPLDQAHAWAYLPDLAQSFERVAARHAELKGHRRLHFAGHTVTGAQMHAAMEQASGRSLKTDSLPWWLIRLASPVVPMWRELLVMRYLWQRAHRLDDGSLRTLVGAQPQTELVGALRASLQALESPSPVRLAQP